MNDFIKQEIKNFIASIKRRSIRASGNVQDFTKIFGKSGSIFGLVDIYPTPKIDPVISISESDVQRMLGIELKAKEIAALTH